MKSGFMKRFLWMLAALLAAGSASAQVRFEECSLDELRRMAVSSSKLVFIDLYADWCGPCKQMDREVFARKNVGDYMAKHYVCIRLDIEKEPGRTLARRYAVESIPTFLIFDTDGRLLVRSAGSRTATRFLRDLRSVAK